MRQLRTYGSMKGVLVGWHSCFDSFWLMLGFQFGIPTSPFWNGLIIIQYFIHVNYISSEK